MAELAEHVINTKVTESAKKRLEAICKQYDFTLYDMLQMLCDCLIRYMDDFQPRWAQFQTVHWLHAQSM